MQLISVVIPNYNHAQFLPKRIESILNQTYSNIEILVLDDCSTDNSREVIEYFKERDTRIKVFYNSVNSGSTFAQWKKGVDLANGEYIWIAESDDYSDIRFLEKLLDAIKKKPGIEVAYCQSNFVDANNEIVGNHIDNLQVLNPTLWQNDFCMDGNDLLANYMLIINVIPNVSAAIFSKRLVGKVNWSEVQSYRLGGDRNFWTQILNNTNLCFTSKSLNYFRIDGNTQRSRYVHSLLYLKEIEKNVQKICSLVKVERKNKTNAVKQWFHYYRKARNNSSENIFKFYFFSIFIFLKLIKIYFK